VNLVGAGFEHHVGDGASAAAQFDIVIGGRHANRRDRLPRRDLHLQQAGAFIVVHAFDLVAVAHTRHAVGVGLQRTGGVEKLRVLEGFFLSSRHQIEQILKIAIDAQRQLLDQLRVHAAAGIGSLRLQRGRVSRDFDGLSDIAGLQLQIDARAVIGFEHRAGFDFLLEAGHFRGDVIRARRQIRKRIFTASVGGARVDYFGVYFG